MQYSRQQLGFTLIEMIISLALFSSVITMSVGALLVLVASNEQLQNEQDIMTNLSFALDSMTREIRTGTRYYCATRPNIISSLPGGLSNIFNPSNDIDILQTNTSDCSSGNSVNQAYHGISFIEGGNSITTFASNRILYYFEQGSGSTPGKIYRRIGAGAPEPIISSSVDIVDADFFVSASVPIGQTAANYYQPTVTIYIEARDINDVTGKIYKVQTTIVQRTLDI